MTRRLVFAPLLLALAGCATGPDDDAQHLRQVPIDFHDWGVYHWTLVAEDVTYAGHVIVRGEEAAAIDGIDVEPGTEAWFFDRVDEGGGESAFSLRLQLQRSHRNRALASTVAQIVETESELGSMLVDPQWEEGAPLSESPAMTLTSCEGPEACEDGLERISLQFPAPQERLPTIYADSDAIVSIFSGEETDFELAEGDTAIFTAVDEGDAGHPEEGWFFVGFDPG